jgi:hypothetical protein
MATDKTQLVITAVGRIAQSATQILTAIEILQEIKDQLASSYPAGMDPVVPLDLLDYADIIAATKEIKHCDPATLKNLLTMPSGIIAKLKDLYDGSPTQQCWQALQATRY